MEQLNTDVAHRVRDIFFLYSRHANIKPLQCVNGLSTHSHTHIWKEGGKGERKIHGSWSCDHGTWLRHVNEETFITISSVMDTDTIVIPHRRTTLTQGLKQREEMEKGEKKGGMESNRTCCSSTQQFVSFIN